MNALNLGKNQGIKLKGCPFCGQEPVFTADRDVIDDFDHSYTISCFVCGISMGDEYKDGAIAAWNRRHEESPSEIERCIK